MALLKNSSVEFKSFEKLLEFCPFNVKKHANELLQSAILNDNVLKVKLLLEKYQAEAAGFFLGMPVIFSLNFDWKILKLLLAHDADPLIEIQGKKFFEQDKFLKDVKKCSFQWFVELYKQGINLAEYMQDRSMTVDFETKKIRCSIPLAVIKDHANELCSETPDLLAPIDKDGNTLLHYAVMNYSKLNVLIRYRYLKKGEEFCWTDPV